MTDMDRTTDVSPQLLDALRVGAMNQDAQPRFFGPYNENDMILVERPNSDGALERITPHVWAREVVAACEDFEPGLEHNSAAIRSACAAYVSELMSTGYIEDPAFASERDKA